ncbi:MAG TPA: hypothetical protein VLU25_02140 [Acidobacteriota bacterium]|nr:hypothetical protein [Acidobacteriota bacterium]
MLQHIILAIVVPIAVTAACVLVFRALADDRQAGLRRGAALGLGLAFAVGHWIILDWPSFPPIDSTRWLAYLALAAALLGLVEGGPKLPSWAHWGLRLILAVGTVWLIGKPIFLNSMQGLQIVLAVVGFSLGLLVLWTEIDQLAARVAGVSVPLALTVLATATSFGLVVSHTASLGQLTGALAAGLGVLAALALLFPELKMNRGSSGVVANLLAGLWVSGYFYASLPLYTVLLLWLSPSALWLAEAGPLRNLGPFAKAVLRVLLIAIPAGAAVYLAYQANATPDDYAY